MSTGIKTFSMGTEERSLAQISLSGTTATDKKGFRSLCGPNATPFFFLQDLQTVERYFLVFKKEKEIQRKLIRLKAGERSSLSPNWIQLKLSSKN